MKKLCNYFILCSVFCVYALHSTDTQHDEFKEIFFTHYLNSEEEINDLNKKCHDLGLALRFTRNPSTNEATAYISLQDRTFSIPQTILESIYNNLVQHNPYHKKEASVRVFSSDNILCKEEINALQKRMLACQKGVQKLVGLSVNLKATPRIALACSGGGVRALIGSAAFIKSLEEQGIWDTIEYVSGLSGSTWTLLPYYNASVSSFNEFYSEHLNRVQLNTLYLEPSVIAETLQDSLHIFALICLQKLIFKEIPSIIDIYGLCLACDFFDEESLDNITAYTLPAQQKNIDNGQRPFPLYTAITDEHKWLTFSPYEVSAPELGSAVPAWAFGRQFDKGVSVNNAPPIRIDLLSGICGSALSISFKETCAMVFDKMEPRMIFSTLSYFGHSAIISDVRIFPAKVPNFTYKMNDLPCAKERYLTLVDAGLDFNLPLPPLLEPNRNIDIIIVLDMSGNVLEAPELKLAEDYAKKHNLPFPKIDYAGITDRTYTIFDDGYDSDAPIIIYVPMIKNSNYSSLFDPQDHLKNGFMNTLNFNYSANNIKMLAGLFEQAARDIKKDFITTLKKVIQRNS